MSRHCSPIPLKLDLCGGSPGAKFFRCRYKRMGRGDEAWPAWPSMPSPSWAISLLPWTNKGEARDNWACLARRYLDIKPKNKSGAVWTVSQNRKNLRKTWRNEQWEPLLFFQSWICSAYRTWMSRTACGRTEDPLRSALELRFARSWSKCIERCPRWQSLILGLTSTDFTLRSSPLYWNVSSIVRLWRNLDYSQVILIQWWHVSKTFGTCVLMIAENKTWLIGMKLGPMVPSGAAPPKLDNGFQPLWFCWVEQF